MSSCRTGFFYDNADKYSHGSASFSSDSVDSIDIDWFSGEVQVLFTAESDADISVTETSNKKTTEETSLHYWLDGDILRIRFAASGKGNLGKFEKKLTVILPRDKTLYSLTVNCESAGVILQDARSEKLFISALGGDVSLNSIRISDEANISTKAGKVRGNAATACDLMNISTSSGDVIFSTDARIREFNVETIGGAIYLANLTPAKVANVNTVSGKISLEFLDNSGFEFTYSTLFGKMNTEVKLYRDGSRYVYGTPNSSFTVKSTTGDLKITTLPT